MQTDLFLERFDDLLTTPDDVAHLEAAILQLAVQGKLVPQDPDDEPAKDLLERIQTEKEQLIRESKIRKPKPIPPVAVEEIPYELPNGWLWCRLGELCTVRGGKRVPKGYQLLVEPTPHIYIRVTDMKDGAIRDADLRYISEEVFQRIQRYIIEKNDLYITIAGTIGCVGEVPEKFHQMNLTENAARITPYQIDKRYLKFVLNSPPIQEQFQEKVNQMAQPKLALMRIKTTLVPLPPLPEQKRIVAKVDELLAQTRALAAQLEGADATLVPTAQAAFQSLLGAPDAATQRQAWQRIADHFGTLTSDLRTIEALKQTILQLAVQGKLVPQDPGDEPAGVLLERIKVERVRLIREKGSKKLKPLPTIADNETPHRLPEGWEWTKLDQLLTGIQAGRSPRAQKRPAKGNERGVLKVSAVTWGEFLPDENKALLSDTQMDGVPHVHVDDFLISRANTAQLVGAVVLVNQDYPHLFLSDKTLRLDFVPSGAFKPYMIYALRAPWVREVFESTAIGTSSSMRNISQVKIRSALIAIPPLAEQKRIVAQVEALLSLCDALSAGVAQAEEVRARLLQAVLNGA